MSLLGSHTSEAKAIAGMETVYFVLRGLGPVVGGLALIGGLGLFVGTLLQALDRLGQRAVQKRAAKAQEIEQHSVRVEVD